MKSIYFRPLIVGDERPYTLQQGSLYLILEFSINPGQWNDMSVYVVFFSFVSQIIRGLLKKNPIAKQDRVFFLTKHVDVRAGALKL